MHSIESIIEDIAQGKMVVIMDDEGRENEGDVIIAAEKVTPFHINFMARFARGLICLPLSKERCQELHLPLMVANNHSKFFTNFTVSIEAATGVTTGISAHDRAHTILTAVADNARPQDIVQPGHIFPIMAQPGGVLIRAGHTEASTDLARLAGLKPAAVLCEILNEDGTMARYSELVKFSKRHGLKLGTIADLIRYRLARETTLKEIARSNFPTQWGNFQLVVFNDQILGNNHFALVYGTPQKDSLASVRVHVSDPILDIPGTPWAEKRWSLEKALAQIAQAQQGALVLLTPQTISSKEWLGRIETLSEQEGSKEGKWPLIGVGSQILSLLGFGKIRVLGEKRHYCALSGFNLEVVEYCPYQD